VGNGYKAWVMGIKRGEWV